MIRFKEIEEHLRYGGKVETKSGKRIFVFSLNRDTQQARVMYHPSNQLRDIPIQNIEIVNYSDMTKLERV